MIKWGIITNLWLLNSNFLQQKFDATVLEINFKWKNCHFWKNMCRFFNKYWNILPSWWHWWGLIQIQIDYAGIPGFTNITNLPFQPMLLQNQNSNFLVTLFLSLEKNKTKLIYVKIQRKNNFHLIQQRISNLVLQIQNSLSDVVKYRKII